jgi:(4S)-4-hydroxy-5-phosphonooxypentane-2,3-dione isomerase
MPTTFLSRFKVKPEKDAEFLGLIQQMEQIAADEPDTLSYKFYRLQEAHAFGVFESFTNEAADLSHQQNPASSPVIEKMLACMDGSYTREYLFDVEV